jgi:hypothetical protein
MDNNIKKKKIGVEIISLKKDQPYSYPYPSAVSIPTSS